jgi:hypothetical protein
LVERGVGCANSVLRKPGVCRHGLGHTPSGRLRPQPLHGRSRSCSAASLSRRWTSPPGRRTSSASSIQASGRPRLPTRRRPHSGVPGGPAPPGAGLGAGLGRPPDRRSPQEHLRPRALDSLSRRPASVQSTARLSDGALAPVVPRRPFRPRGMQELGLPCKSSESSAPGLSFRTPRARGAAGR